MDEKHVAEAVPNEEPPPRRRQRMPWGSEEAPGESWQPSTFEALAFIRQHMEADPREVLPANISGATTRALEGWATHLGWTRPGSVGRAVLAQVDAATRTRERESGSGAPRPFRMPNGSKAAPKRKWEVRTFLALAFLIQRLREEPPGALPANASGASTRALEGWATHLGWTGANPAHLASGWTHGEGPASIE